MFCGLGLLLYQERNNTDEDRNVGQGNKIKTGYVESRTKRIEKKSSIRFIFAEIYNPEAPQTFAFTE